MFLIGCRENVIRFFRGTLKVLLPFLACNSPRKLHLVLHKMIYLFLLGWTQSLAQGQCGAQLITIPLCDQTLYSRILANVGDR